MSRAMRFGRYDLAAFLCFITYAASSMIIPMVLYALALDMKFPLQEGGRGLGGALQLGRSIPMVISMLFCGFAAARFGKAKTIGFSQVVMGTGILCSAFAPGYAVLFLAIAVAGLGEGMIEGLATPFIQDQHQEEPGRYINFSHGFWSVGILLTVLIAGALLTAGIYWRYIVAATGICVLIPSLLFLLPDRKGALKQGQQGVSASEVVKNTAYILRSPRFWLFFTAIFLAGGGEYCLTFWTASYIRLEFANSSMWLAGIGTACFAGGMIFGRLGPGYFVKQNGLPILLISFGIAASLLSVIMPFLHTLWLFFLILFLSGVATGPFWPSIQSYCSDRMPKAEITMLYVLLSCAGVPGCGFFTWLMGATGDLFGMRESLYLVPICFTVMSLLIALDIWNKKRTGKNAA